MMLKPQRSPYSRTNRRICLQPRSKKDFKAVNTSIASISCERSKPVIITDNKAPLLQVANAYVNISL